jgi:fumarate reductase subunit D
MTGGFFVDDDENEKKTEPETKQETEVDEGKNAAIFAYVPFLCFIPLVKMRDNEFALKHGKQGLILLFIEIIALLFLAIPKINELFWAVVLTLCIISAASGILYAVNGKSWKMPFIGDLAEKLKL